MTDNFELKMALIILKTGVSTKVNQKKLLLLLLEIIEI